MSGEKALIISAVLQYLIENPNAQDTIEGVAGWWLLKQEVGRRTQEVKEALDELVAHGYVLEIVGGDSRTYYSVNPGKWAEISALLTRLSSVHLQPSPSPLSSV